MRCPIYFPTNSAYMSRWMAKIQNKIRKKRKKNNREVQKSMDVECMGHSMLSTPKWDPSCVTSAIKNLNFRFGSRFFETQKFEFQSMG